MQQNRIPFIDYLRVVACLMVMLVHASKNFYGADWSGLAANVSMLATEENTPPAAIFIANDDDLVDPVSNGMAYYAAMHKAGRSCSLYIHPNGGHGFCLNAENPASALVKDEMFTWIKTIMK